MSTVLQNPKLSMKSPSRRWQSIKTRFIIWTHNQLQYHLHCSKLKFHWWFTIPECGQNIIDITRCTFHYPTRWNRHKTLASCRWQNTQGHPKIDLHDAFEHAEVAQIPFIIIVWIRFLHILAKISITINVYILDCFKTDSSHRHSCSGTPRFRYTAAI